MVSAITGVMVVEYIASNAGLGYLTCGPRLDDMPLMFAAILTTAFLGLVLNLALTSVELLLMPWLKRDHDS
jgi:ABC-type nitrate/sulfonate/bicarbonate transport system permease component